MEKHLYTGLLQTVRATLSSVIGVLDGVEAMSNEIRECMADLHHDRVPQSWKNLARVRPPECSV